MAVDLFDKPIWQIFAIALLVLTPMQNANARKWALALLNLAFAAHLVSKKLAVILLTILVAQYVVLRLLQAGRNRIAVATVAGLGLFCLWIMHKLPHLASAVHAGKLGTVLTAIGFSYVFLRMIDAMRAVIEEGKPAPDFAQTINYFIPFNMLAAGPIQAYNDFIDAPVVPQPLTVERTLAGVERVVNGLIKKYVLALTLQRLFLTDFKSHGSYLFFEAQVYYVWLYLDFSAYSDVAIGIGSLLGISTPENFDRPFLSRNVIDFWQRWHISLSQFVRRNIFVPVQLALMRRTNGQHQLATASLAFFVSFFLCGLWHNVSFRWMLWGIMQSVGLIVCNLYRHAMLKRHGRKWLNNNLANPWIRAVSIVLTFEFAALTLAATMYSY